MTWFYLLPLAVSLAAEPSDRVLYVPGWLRCGDGEDDALLAVRREFPEAEVSVRDWEGNSTWRKSRAHADDEAEKLAAELKFMTGRQRRHLTLVGHSLGGRVVVRAMALLAEEGLSIRRGIVLGAAIPRDDPALQPFASASMDPALVVCNPKDSVLKFFYRPFGGEGGPALGAVGPAAALENCEVRFVSHDTVRSTPLDAFWAKFGWIRDISAHYAPFYIRQAGMDADAEAATLQEPAAVPCAGEKRQRRRRPTTRPHQ